MASEKVTALVEEVKGLTVLELSELVHTLEDVFGVSAAAAAVSSGAATVTATGVTASRASAVGATSSRTAAFHETQFFL